MLGIIRVFTTPDKEAAAAHERLIAARFGLAVTTLMIDDQPLGIYDDITHEQAVPKIVAAAKNAAAGGVTAVLISCAADPGIEECRQAVSIPVIGAGAAAAGIALALGSRVGVLNLTAATPPAIADVLGVKLVDERQPQGVCNTTDLLTPAGLNAAIDAAKALARQADVIVLACTGYSTIGLAGKLRTITAVPVVDAVEAGGAIACYYMRRR